MATCAACMLPIANRAQLVIMETEVLHKGCVGRTTVLWVARQDAARAEKLATEAIAVGQRATLLVERAGSEREERAALQQRALIAEAQLEGVRTMRDGLIQSNADLRREIAELQAAARIQQRPLVPPVVPVPVATPEPVASAEAVQDDAVARFSLMELD